MSQVLMNFNTREVNNTTGGLNRTSQAESSVISEYTNWKKYLGVEREKKYPTRQFKVCAAHKERSELDIYVNCAWCTST